MNGVNTPAADGLVGHLVGGADAIEVGVGEANATQEPPLTEEEVSEANAALVRHMCRVLENSYCSAVELRHKLRHTYWIVIGLTIVMFALGMVLISTPVWAPLLNAQIPGDGPFDMTNILTTVGVGAADLIALFIFGPITRIQRLMGSFSQLTVGLETYQMQVAIRLIEADSKDRPTLGVAAGHVAAASIVVLDAIKKYYAADLETPTTPITLQGAQAGKA